jgi:hypothetical protein
MKFISGMFPYVCLATMPLFCRVDWPRRLGLYFNWMRRTSPINVDLIDANNMKKTDSQVKESLESERSVLPSNKISQNEATHKGKQQMYSQRYALI